MALRLKCAQSVCTSTNTLSGTSGSEFRRVVLAEVEVGLLWCQTTTPLILLLDARAMLSTSLPPSCSFHCSQAFSEDHSGRQWPIAVAKMRLCETRPRNPVLISQPFEFPQPLKCSGSASRAVIRFQMVILAAVCPYFPPS